MTRLLLPLLLTVLLLPAPSVALDSHILCGTRALPPRGVSPASKPLQTTLLHPFVVGDTLTFRAFDFGSGKPYTLTATCRLVGQHCYAFVQDEEWNTRVRLPQIQGLADAFDRSAAADTTRGIFDLDTATFGPPPDVDGDPRILILVLDIQDGYASTGNFFAGYFDFANESPPIGREVLFIDDRPLDLDSRLARATLVHEFQHMIHWNADSKEEKWVDEGCSEYAERMSGYADTTGVAQAFLSFPNVGLTEWQDLSLDYEKSMLFVAYFAHRYGRPSLRRLVQDRAHGVAGFASALSAIEGAGTFTDLFADWIAANLLDAAGRYGYADLQLASLTAEKMSALPLGPSPRRVHAWAARYFDFGKQEGLRVGFEGGAQDTFRVRLVTVRAGVLGVLDMTLSSANKGAVQAVRADRIVAVIGRAGGGSGEVQFFISADPFQPSPASLCDFDGDGRVDFDDFFLFADRFGRSSGQGGFDPLFDLDGDRSIGLEDFFRFAEHFGETG
ncbi:MAG: hypothetical protein EXS64_17585 [Candidatus Latescibacteria bacterium]|nr:hypothetical protein [Candidatus Latescibacterota bacterium]